MQPHAPTPFKALILRDFSRLGMGKRNPLHPHPSRPIINTRAGCLPMGLGGNCQASSHYHSKKGSGMVVAKVGVFPLQYQRLSPNYYHTTTKTRPLHVCARAPMRAHGSLYIYGSMVVDIYKALFPKGKSPYFCPLPCHYHGKGLVVVPVNPLKNLNKGDF